MGVIILVAALHQGVCKLAPLQALHISMLPHVLGGGIEENRKMRKCNIDWRLASE